MFFFGIWFSTTLQAITGPFQNDKKLYKPRNRWGTFLGDCEKERSKAWWPVGPQISTKILRRATAGETGDHVTVVCHSKRTRSQLTDLQRTSWTSEGSCCSRLDGWVDSTGNIMNTGIRSVLVILVCSVRELILEHPSKSLFAMCDSSVWIHC